MTHYTGYKVSYTRSIEHFLKKGMMITNTRGGKQYA